MKTLDSVLDRHEVNTAVSLGRTIVQEPIEKVGDKRLERKTDQPGEPDRGNVIREIALGQCLPNG